VQALEALKAIGCEGRVCQFEISVSESSVRAGKAVVCGGKEDDYFFQKYLGRRVLVNAKAAPEWMPFHR
jgi:hypothetical protein